MLVMMVTSNNTRDNSSCCGLECGSIDFHVLCSSDDYLLRFKMLHQMNGLLWLQRGSGGGPFASSFAASVMP